MKVTIEVDCTPEEMRRTMGLPDLGPMQERYLAQFADLAGGMKPDAIEGLLRQWAPMGEAGMGLWRALLAASTQAKDGGA